MRTKPKQGLLTKAGRKLKKSSPTILTCLGAVGVVATAVLAVKATPKALECVQEAQTVKAAESDEKLTRTETIAACWQCYIPAAAVGIATVGCIFGANILNRHQQATLASAYALLDRSYKDYKQSVKNVFGEEGHKRVLADIADEKVNPKHTLYAVGAFESTTLDFNIPEEEHLFYDAYSGRKFTSTIGKVLQAEYHLNRMFSINGDVSLNDFYRYLGISPVNDGDNIAWDCDTEYENDRFWIDFNHSVTYIDDGPDRPPLECLVIEFSCHPYPYPTSPDL